MEKQLQILYLEDSPADAGLTRHTLKRSGLLFNMLVVETEHEFTRQLKEFNPDLILSDHSLPGFNSMAAFKIVLDQKPGTPFILLTGSVSEQFAVDCLLAGIDDYILKSNLIRLPSSIERILSKKRISLEKETFEAMHNQLKETNRQIEIKNKEITDSINYAKRIQDAILPPENQFTESLYSGFVIYEPRDIVSGDLYWLANTTTTDGRKLSLKIIAAIDCTGHGIPGAFLSLLVSELLNQTLKNDQINSPADVLSYLNQRLPARLNKHNREQINDGLDMALCAMDMERKMLYYSGANRPLWIIRKNETDCDLIEYAPTKACIGAHTSPEQLFECHAVSLEAGDRLYLFTDGITDQFGGHNGKKLGRKLLKELLQKSFHLDMQHQKEYISDFLLEWRKDLEQTDDMLLIGIEIK